MTQGTFNNVKSRQCQYCLSLFSNMTGSEFANHSRWCKKNPNNKTYRNQISRLSLTENNKRFGLSKNFGVICHTCKIPFVVNERELSFPLKKRYFCSIRCATSYSASKINHQSQSFSESVSKGLIDKWKNDPDYARKCMSHNKAFTSKGERNLRDWFIYTYPLEKWTFGGTLKFGSIYGIVRDLYSNILKICIEYDGDWHFKDLVGQLESKQLKDQALEKWCLSNKFRLIRIKDEIYQENPSHWKKKIREEIDTGSIPVVKFY